MSVGIDNDNAVARKLVSSDMSAKNTVARCFANAAHGTALGQSAGQLSDERQFLALTKQTFGGEQSVQYVFKLGAVELFYTGIWQTTRSSEQITPELVVMDIKSLFGDVQSH